MASRAGIEYSWEVGDEVRIYLEWECEKDMEMGIIKVLWFIHHTFTE